MKRLAAVLLLSGCAGLAQAQLRTIPPDAQRGVIRHVQEMIVEIDGTQRRLAPAAQIRDNANRIVMPTAIPLGAIVKYRLDRDGFVLQVWLLTPEEARGE